ncbi:PAS domain S-box protein [Nitrincola lacisaponensis]|uniref:PAS domain S-box protein n=1 Tax=Nitrincola lacisaponensis TaxID=267850 RepID=UPI0012680994|nr:PAS domain S-box protein [Nitrincola lacisaponensis]
MAKLREQFIAQLPEKMHAIAQQAGCIDLTSPTHSELLALHRLLHNLTGSAGTFGLHSLSDMARQTERLLDHLRNTEDKVEQQAIASALSVALQRMDKLARSAPDRHAPSLTAPKVMRPPKGKRSPLLYVVEDDSQQGQKLIGVLEEAGYCPRLLDGLSAFSAAMRADELPAAIIIDMVFPDGDLAGAEYIRQEREAYSGSFPPVVFLSVRQDLDARLAAYRSGAAHYLNKPVSSERLLRLLDEITQRVPPEPYRVLMVDDEPLILEAQASMLRAAGMQVSTLQDPRKTLEQMQTLDPEVLVLDFHMPEISGPELAALLREDERYHQLPIVFLSAELDPDWQSQALSLGGDDFLQKPVVPDYLINRVSSRAHRARELRAKQSEIQQLLYQREREHLALNQHAIVSIADSAGNITYVNDLFCDISGYCPEELLGKNHRLLKSGQHPDSLYKEMWATIVSGQTWFGEVCNRRKDGSLYWVESTITPFLDESGKPYQYVSIRTDISHAKAVEQELARLSQVASQTTNGVVITDMAGRVEWVNDGFTRISGYTLDDMLGRKPGELLQGPETDPCTLARIRAALERGEGFKADLVNYTNENKPYWIRIQCNPLRDNKGSLQGFMAIESDVTQEKEDAYQLAATLESTKDGILAVDASGKMLFMNLQFRQMWSMTEPMADSTSDEQLLAHAMTQLLDPEGFMQKVKVLYQSTEELDDLIELLDGRVFERHSKPLRRDGKSVGRLWSFHDITQRLRAEQAAEAAKERLRRGQLYANIGTWEWDIVTGELFWSERIAPLFGYPAGDLETSYVNFLAAVHPDDRQAVIDAVAACIENDAPYDIEHRVVWPDGTVRWLLERGAVQRDAEGNPLSMIGVVQDIDERKRAVQDLLIFRRVFDATEQGIGVTDAEGF